jgi:hypothetical protein
VSIPAAPSAPAKRPIAIIVIAGIVVLEALALLAVAGWFVYGLLTQTPTSFGGAVFQLVLLVLLAGWLLAVGHFLFRGYRWTRAAALVWQLFVIVIAVPTLSGGLVVVVMLLIFTRPVTEFLTKGAAPTAL